MSLHVIAVRVVTVGRLVLLLMGLVLGGQAAHAASPAEGQQVYQQHCQQCHGADGRNRFQGKVDFSLGEGLQQTDRHLKRRIERGLGFCPSYLGVLRADDIYNVIAYLRTFQ